MLFCILDISYAPNSACTTGGQSTLRCLVISEYRLHALLRAPVGILLEHSFINSTSSSNHLLNCEFVMTQVTMTVTTSSDIETLCRPCVDCGRKPVATATIAKLRIECHQRSGRIISRPHYAHTVIASMMSAISAGDYIGALHLSMMLSLKVVTPLTS